MKKIGDNEMIKSCRLDNWPHSWQKNDTSELCSTLQHLHFLHVWDYVHFLSRAYSWSGPDFCPESGFHINYSPCKVLAIMAVQNHIFCVNFLIEESFNSESMLLEIPEQFLALFQTPWPMDFMRRYLWHDWYIIQSPCQ